MIDSLVLGTVQLGMPYGINNRIGQPGLAAACDIVQTAFDQGITRFDTAQAYGDSEKVLGQVFKKLALASRVKVYSKLHPNMDLLDVAAIHHSVDESLQKLKLDHLEGLSLHREDAFAHWNTGLRSALDGLVKLGKIRTVGGSFCSPQKALEVLDLDGIDLLQVPANAFDRRFEKGGVFRKARDLNKRVFVRSIFLQGLLLMPVESIPPHMSSVRTFIQKFSDLARDRGVSRQELSISCVKRRYPDSFFIVGAEEAGQVLDAVRSFQNARDIEMDDGVFEGVPENILNPSLWTRL